MHGFAHMVLRGNKGLHTLRKEAGAIVATRDGIFAASEVSDMAISPPRRHTTRTKEPHRDWHGHVLEAGETDPGNIIKMKPETCPRCQEKQ